MLIKRLINVLSQKKRVIGECDLCSKHSANTMPPCSHVCVHLSVQSMFIINYETYK